MCLCVSERIQSRIVATPRWSKEINEGVGFDVDVDVVASMHLTN